VLQLGHAGEPPKPSVEADVEQNAEFEGEGDDEIDEGGVEIVGPPVKPLESNDIRHHRAEPEKQSIQQEQVAVPQVPRQVEFHFVING
jgi:hypothetical protein